MLISYPILPADADSQDEATRLTRMLAMTQSDRGLYPITTGNRWHGGVHLTPGDEPIRAIADGTIVAYRKTPDTLNYAGQGDYDTSFVLIRHETESGEHTPLVFYSLYMHLQPFSRMNQARQDQIIQCLREAPTSEDVVIAQTNTRVWRKEVLGFGGQLYGRPTVHFEIFATDADFQRFWRDRNAIAAGGHGSDDVFGNTYFILPAGRPFAERHPHAATPHRIDLPGRNAFYDLPVGQAGQNADPLLVIVKLSRGQRITTSFRLDAHGRPAAVLGELVQDAYEYELFRLATALYPDCPSAGFEYLRFGRILGPDRTTRDENWQLVPYADGASGYLDLAAQANHVTVLSDADFPLLWEKLDEGQAASATDGMANLPRLNELLQLPPEPTTPSLYAPPDFATRASDDNVQAHLRHVICKHPSEWDATDLATRYAALRQPGNPLQAGTAWQQFKAHVEKMAFWPKTGLERSVWHFHPLQFIQHYRKCLWLSEKEIRQLVPKKVVRGVGAGWRGPFFYERVPGNGRLIATHRVRLNEMWRKYAVTTHRRLAAFVGNSVQETAWWRTLEEGGGAQTRYAPWYGRGFLQLTWEENYRTYWGFVGKDLHPASATQIASWRADVSSNPYDAANSAGAYWSWKNANSEADEIGHNTRRTVAITQDRRSMRHGQSFSVYENAPFRRVACLINLPGDIDRTEPRLMGLVDRYSAYANAQVVLLDSATFPTTQGGVMPLPEDFEARR